MSLTSWQVMMIKRILSFQDFSEYCFYTVAAKHETDGCVVSSVPFFGFLEEQQSNRVLVLSQSILQLCTLGSLEATKALVVVVFS